MKDILNKLNFKGKKIGKIKMKKKVAMKSHFDCLNADK